MAAGLEHSGFPHSVRFEITTGPQTPDRLYSLIVRLAAEFPEYEMRLPLSGDAGNLVRQLGDRGLIKVEEMPHPSAGVTCIVRTVPPARSDKP